MLTVRPCLPVQLLVSVYLSHSVPLQWKESAEGGQLLSAKSCPLLLLFTKNTSICLLLMDWDFNQIWPLEWGRAFPLTIQRNNSVQETRGGSWSVKNRGGVLFFYFKNMNLFRKKCGFTLAVYKKYFKLKPMRQKKSVIKANQLKKANQKWRSDLRGQ